MGKKNKKCNCVDNYDCVNPFGGELQYLDIIDRRIHTAENLMNLMDRFDDTKFITKEWIVNNILKLTEEETDGENANES